MSLHLFYTVFELLYPKLCVTIGLKYTRKFLQVVFLVVELLNLS